jgi:O-antigen ligase
MAMTPSLGTDAAIDRRGWMYPRLAHRQVPLYAAPTLGVVAGCLTAVLGSLVASEPVKMAALPAAIALFFFLLVDRKILLLAILLLRSAGDIVFSATKVSLAGYQIGVGGLINAFVILIVLLLVIEKPGLLPRRMIAPWAGFLLAASAGVVLSPVKADAVRIFLSVLSYFAIFVSAFYVVKSPADFRFCVRVVLWSSMIPVIHALVEIATGGADLAAGGTRIQSTFAHPNIFAFYLVLVISLTLYMVKSTGETLSAQARTGLRLFMLLLLVLLLLTQTRSAWVACFTIFAIYGAIFERRYLVYIVLAPLLALLVPGVQDRLLDLAAGNEYMQYARLNSFAWRRMIWETGLQWMQPNHYLLGYGLDAFRHYSLVFFPLTDPSGSGSGAHNVYVQLLFEVGAIGLLAYLWLFSRLLRQLRAMLSLDRLGTFISIATVAGYMIISLSDNMLAYLSFNWYFWFVAGSACAAVDAHARRVSEARQSAPGMNSVLPGGQRLTPSVDRRL